MAEEIFRQGAGRGLFAPAAQKAPLLAPRHPLPPPVSLDEEGVGFEDGAQCPKTRGRGGVWGGFCAERSEDGVKRARLGKTPPRNRHSPGNRGIHAFKN